MAGLYLPSGYVNIDHIINHGNTFTFIVGARGTGKTYGMLKYLLMNGIRFLYLRRTDTEAQLVQKEILNPFKSINMDMDVNVRVEKHKDIGVFTMGEESIGYAAALSTFYKIRGTDFSDVDVIFYDEFIPEKTARPIKEEFTGLMNMFETVNRNRELKGMDPVRLICCANANKLDNPIFLNLEIVNKLAKLMQKGTEVYQDDSRELTVYMLMKSPISHQKAQTALYKLTAGNQFQDMALFNMFELNTDNIRSCRLVEYRPVIKVGEICIWKHKSRREWYVNTAPAGTIQYKYTASDIDIKRFQNKHMNIFDEYLMNRVFFEDPVSMYLFEKFYE